MRMQKAAMALAVVTAVCAGLAARVPAGAAPEPEARRARMGIVVPAYFYPGGEGLKHWNTLIESDRGDVPITVIVNPASGPGVKVDPAYTTVLNRAKKRGLKLIGYVSTSYGKRPREEVLADLPTWLRFYPQVQGYFFDEQASDASKAEVYAEYYTAAHEKIPGALVVNNPGVPCAEQYVNQPAADMFCIFEHHQGYYQFHPPAWTRTHPKGKFLALGYAETDAEGMRKFVKKTAADGIGNVFVTEDKLPNPWDSMPKYWDAELDAVKALGR